MRLNLAYFDTSAWNDLVDHVESEAIVAALGSRAVIVFASVISPGEILKTPSADRRERLSSVMLKLHGDVALLERPMTLAAEAARAFFREERDFSLPRTGPGRSLLEFLNCPNTADTSSIAAWLQNLDRNHERFLKEIRPELPDPKTLYYSPELLHAEPFLKLLSTVPAAQELGLSIPQIAKLTAQFDVWRALALIGALTPLPPSPARFVALATLLSPPSLSWSCPRPPARSRPMPSLGWAAREATCFSSPRSSSWSLGSSEFSSSAAWETWSTCHCSSVLRFPCSRFFALVKRPCGA